VIDRLLSLGLQIASLAIAFGPGVVVACLVTWFFLREERAGRSSTSTVIILGVTMLDAAVFPSFGTSNGIFRPTLLGHGVPLPIVLTPLGLLARVLAGRPLLRRPRTVLLLWGLFWALFVVAAVNGASFGNDSGQIGFEASAFVNVACVSLLAAGTSVRDLIGDGQLPRLARCASIVAGVLVIGSLLGVHAELSTPVASFPDLGTMGADAATMFASIGVLLAGIELSAPVIRRRVVVAAVILCLAPAASDQRAALIAVVTSVLVATAGVWRARNRGVIALRAVDLRVTAVALIAATAIVVLVAQLTTGELPGAAIVREIDSTAKLQSARSRLNQWHAAWTLFHDHLWLGHGLGFQYVHFEEGFQEFWVQDITHNVVLDIALRMGLVGVAAFLLAMAATLGAGWGSLRQLEPRTAALQAAVIGALAGLLSRGMVESILEKHRLAVLLGALVGLCYSCAQGRGARADVVDAVGSPVLAREGAGKDAVYHHRPGAGER
jgi:O-antigen ligase